MSHPTRYWTTRLTEAEQADSTPVYKASEIDKLLAVHAAPVNDTTTPLVKYQAASFIRTIPVVGNVGTPVYLAADVDPLLAKLKDLEEQWHYAATCDADLDSVEENRKLKAQLAEARAMIARQKIIMDGDTHDQCELEREMEKFGMAFSDEYGGLFPVRVISDYITALRTSHAKLEEALTKAVDTIKVWHGINSGGMPLQQEYIWGLYQNSPEMKLINQALAKEPHDSLRPPA